MRNEKGQFVKGHKSLVTKSVADKISRSNKGKKKPPRSVEHTKRQSESHKNQSKVRTVEWNKNISLSKKGKHFFKLSEAKKGQNNPMWKGGITPIHQKIRGSVEYRLWRKSVLERDNHNCIWCFSTDNLQADHIKSFAHYPELRFAIDNGRTLCFNCHKTTENYGGKNKSKTWVK